MNLRQHKRRTLAAMLRREFALRQCRRATRRMMIREIEKFPSVPPVDQLWPLGITKAEPFTAYDNGVMGDLLHQACSGPAFERAADKAHQAYYEL